MCSRDLCNILRKLVIELETCFRSAVRSDFVLIPSSGYGSQGERLVAGVVPLSADKYYVLLIQSTRRGGWVLPKGGWENDEATAQDAAKREAWEEAGVICTVSRDLGAMARDAQAVKAVVHIHPSTRGSGPKA